MEAPAHPLAEFLAARDRPAEALLVGVGSGRNIPPFLRSGHRVTALDEDPERLRLLPPGLAAAVALVRAPYDALPFPAARFDLLLATHVLPHGTLASCDARLREWARVCHAGAGLGVVAASVTDARYGRGRRIAPQSFAPTEGEEEGVPHVFVTREQLESWLAPSFEITEITEVVADDHVGRWAHGTAEGLRHYFVTGKRRGSIRS